MSDWQAAPKGCRQTETHVALCTASQLGQDASTDTWHVCVCTTGQAKIWTHKHWHTWWCQCCSLEEGRQTSSGCIVLLYPPLVLTAQNTHQHKTGGVQRHAKTRQCQRTTLPTSNIHSSQSNLESPSLCLVSHSFLTSLPLQITSHWTKYVVCRLKHQHHSETYPCVLLMESLANSRSTTKRWVVQRLLMATWRNYYGWQRVNGWMKERMNE